MAFSIEMQRIFRRIRPGLLGINNRPSRNLEVVIEDLKNNPKWLKQMRADAEEFLVTQDFIPALTESGMMSESGFFAELIRKIEYKLLPKALDENDFLNFLRGVFDAAGGADWIATVREDVIVDFITLIVPDGDRLLTDIGPQLFRALEILGLRLAYFGLESDVSVRLNERMDLRNAFLNVQHDLQRLLDEKDRPDFSPILGNLKQCREAANFIRSKRASEGASLGLTYSLMRIQELAGRMKEILEVLETMVGKWSPNPLVKLLKQIMINETKRFEVRSFISRHIELLAFQITEHTGRTGEHYITTTRSEYNEMFKSASIGGAVVGIITICKVEISAIPIAPALHALAYGLLYSAGFIALHTLGGTLASKQPAMTASRIAGALDKAHSSDEALMNLTEMIVRTVRSQLIALLGNYLIAFPTAFLICTPFMALHIPLISHSTAETLLTDLHPWKSLSLWYAACAGCCLFASGIVAGAADNWFVFDRVGKRLQRAALLRKLVPVHGLKRAIAFIDHNLGFWVGNTTLGFLLGSAGFFGMIFGLPINIRHVTFSSAQFGLAVASRPFEVTGKDFALIAASVFCMGLINLAVSFSLTLYVTMKSRKIRFSQTPKLFQLCLARFLRRPFDFFYPPPDPA